MNITELNREQLTFLKQAYMTQLADEGTFAEMFETDHDEPSWAEITFADLLVPDEVIFDHYEGTDFVEEDFFV